MVDFRPKAVPPEVQRQLKFKPQLQAKEDVLKSVIDKQMRPLARLMLHLSKMSVSKVPEGPDKIEANLRHMMKLTELVSQRFWISFSEVAQARKSVGFQALGMTEAESSKTDSYLNEADLLRIKEVVKHRARVQELGQGLQKKPLFKKKQFKPKGGRAAASTSSDKPITTRADEPRGDATDSSLQAGRPRADKKQGSTPTRQRGAGRGGGKGK